MKDWGIYATPVIGILLMLLALSGCSDHESDPLFGEAVQAAQEYLDRTAVKCGEDYYVQTDEDELYRLKGPVAVPMKSKLPLTPADNLNHIEWEGKVMVMISAHREYSEADKKWSDWRSFEPSVYNRNPILERRLLDCGLVKKNGRWSTYPLGYPKLIKPDCAKLPAE